MQNLTPAVGDLVAWDGKKWTVEAIIPNGSFLAHIQGLPPETYESREPLLLVTNTDGSVSYAPLPETRV